MQLTLASNCKGDNAEGLLPPVKAGEGSLSPSIHFDPVAHRYTDQFGREYVSVTRLLDAELGGFDRDEIAEAVIRNPRSRYYGKTKEEVLQQWGQIRDAGTELHAAIAEWVMRDELPDLTDPFFPIVNKFQCAKWKGKLRCEMLLHDPEHLVAGTADLIEDLSSKYLRVWDIKTCRLLGEDKIFKYSLQLELYRRMLAQITGRTCVVGGILWVVDYFNNPLAPVKIIPTVECSARVDQILAKRRAALVEAEASDMRDVAARLKPYQVPHVAGIVRSFEKFDGVLDGSDCGAGKTFTALAVARMLGRQPVAIVPKVVIPSWQKAAAHMGVTNLIVQNYEKLRTGNYELGTWKEDAKKRRYFEWTLPPNCLLICDEVHRCSGMTSLQGKILQFATCTDAKILAMSATAGTEPRDFRALGSVLGLFDPKNFFPWLMSNGYQKGRFGFQFTCGLKHPADPALLREKQSAVMNQIHQKIYGSGRGHRLRISDIPDFPETSTFAESVMFNGNTPLIQAAYDEMQAELDTLNTRTKEDTRSAMTIMLRARQRTELLKVPGFVEMAEDLVASGNSAPIFVNFDATVDALCERLKTKCVVRGGQSDADRQQNIEAFNADVERIIICNIQAGSVGMSLHDLHGRFPRVSLISPSFYAILVKQALGRIPRSGARTKCVNKIVFAAGTVEEKACAAAELKLNNIDALNDADMAAGIRLLGGQSGSPGISGLL